MTALSLSCLHFLFVDMFDAWNSDRCCIKADMLDKDAKLQNQRVLFFPMLLVPQLVLCAVLLLLPHLLKCFRCCRRRTYRSLLLLFPLFCSPFQCSFPRSSLQSIICNCSGSDRGWIPYVTSVTKIDFGDLTEALPAFMPIIAMPFLYNLFRRYRLGVISLIINVCNRKGKKIKKISGLMYWLLSLF